MANYPLSQPVIERLGTTYADPPHSNIHDTMRDELAAVAAELGVNPAGGSGTLRARLDGARPGRSVFERVEPFSSSSGGVFGVEVPFTSEVRDDDGWGSAGDSTFVCPATGLYVIGAKCVVDTAGGSDLRLVIGATNNNQGAEIISLGNAPPSAGRENMIAAGEPVRVRFYHFPGSSPGTASQWSLFIQRIA